MARLLALVQLSPEIENETYLSLICEAVIKSYVQEYVSTQNHS